MRTEVKTVIEYPSLLRPTAVESIMVAGQLMAVPKAEVTLRSQAGTPLTNHFGPKPLIDFGGCRKRDRLPATQPRWLAAGLRAGLQPENFLFVEWDFHVIQPFMLLGTINQRSIHYFNVRQSALGVEDLLRTNWLLFAIADEYIEALFERISTDCMKRHPIYGCSAGVCAAEFDFIFDEDIVAEALAWEAQHYKPYDYDNGTISAIHYDFDEGFWFATSAARHPLHTIEKIICLDLAGIYQNRILALIKLINSGWPPPDPSYDQGTTVRIM